MTKTQHINLNLLEPHDGLDPAALNANARAVDAAVTADRADAAAEHTAVYGEISRLDGRADALTALANAKGNCKIACGTYIGNGVFGEANPTRFSPGFKPMALLVTHSSSGVHRCYVMVRGVAKHTTEAFGTGSSAYCNVVWREDGMDLWASSAHYQYNSNGTTYHYVIIGAAPA